MAKMNKTAPFLRCGETARLMQGDLLAALLPTVIIAVMQAGFRPLFLCAVSAAAAWTAESAVLFFRGRRLAGASAVNIGLLVALVCPASVPWWLPVLGSAAGVLLVKAPFSGLIRPLAPPLARPLFHPAAFIWLLLGVIFPSYMNRFPVVSADNILPVFGDPSQFAQGASVAHLLQLQSRPPYGLSELLVGNLPGPMGTTSLFVIAACAVYLIYRRAAAWQATAGMVGICVLLGLLVDRGNAGAGWSVLFELSAGGFLFAAVYLAADPAAIPRLPLARLLYGVLCGALAMIFRYLGMENGGVPAAILAAQLAGYPLDRLILYMRQGERRDFYRLHKTLLARRLRGRDGKERGESEEGEA